MHPPASRAGRLPIEVLLYVTTMLTDLPDVTDYPAIKISITGQSEISVKILVAVGLMGFEPALNRS